MRITKSNWWNSLTESVIGFDDDAAAAAAAQASQVDGQQQAAAGAPGSGQGGASTTDEGQGAVEDVSGLKSALEKERNEKKALDKELKAYRKAEQDRADADKSEIQKATDSASASAAKVTRLAQGYRNNAVNSTIIAAASKAKFLDPNDAIRPEVIDAIGVEQDEDDPSKVTIDAASVTKAIKDLAAAKKHYVAQPEKQTPRSGSQFGGSGGGSLTADEVALRNKYPALRGLTN